GGLPSPAKRRCLRRNLSGNHPGEIKGDLPGLRREMAQIKSHSRRRFETVHSIGEAVHAGQTPHRSIWKRRRRSANPPEEHHTRTHQEFPDRSSDVRNIRRVCQNPPQFSERHLPGRYRESLPQGVPDAPTEEKKEGVKIIKIDPGGRPSPDLSRGTDT